MKAPFRTPRFASMVSGTIAAAVFAALFSVIGNIEYWFPPLEVEFKKPSPVTVRLSTSVYLNVSHVKNAYVERWFPARIGEEIINKERFRFVESYVKSKKEVLMRRIAGFFTAAFLLAFFFSQNLRLAWPGRRRFLRSELSCYFLILMSLFGIKSFLLFTYLPFTLMPLAAITAITIFFLGRRIGFMMGAVVSFMAGMMLDLDLIAFLYFLVQGLAVLPVLKYYRRKRKFFIATIFITISGVIIIPALAFMLSGTADTNTIISWRNLLMIAAAGGGITCYPILWLMYGVVRPLLGIVSQSKLNELQELSHPLIKKLQEQAPATWEHSRAVANLAEEAASKIGADALLVRVGAYFHDIGKAAAPEFFVENYSLNGKTGSGPHKNLPPEKSAELIIDHVTEGVKILRSNSMPEAVIEFVYMHHGTNTVEFFWRKYNEQNKDSPEEERYSRSHFTYPGVRPQSPEPAILMLADGAEAASRTLREYTTDEIQKVVSHVFMVRLLVGQLDESGLTMDNLKTVLRSFVDSIHFSHHTRVKYQWQKEPREEEKPPAPLPLKPPTRPKAEPPGKAKTAAPAKQALSDAAELEKKEAAEPASEKENNLRDSIATPLPGNQQD